MSLRGFVSAKHPLSTRTAFRDLRLRSLVEVPPADLWERDTALLPRSLQRYRRSVREFARTELAPLVAVGDLDPHVVFTPVLAAAARAGLLTDLLPSPIGSLGREAARPLHLVQSLKSEELAAVCGGFSVLIGAHGLGAMPVILSGSVRAIRRHIVPSMRASAAGNPHVFAFAITEPGGGSDVEDAHGAERYRPQTTARRAPGGWVISGRKVFISDGSLADAVTVFAALEGEGLESWTCFVVDRGMAGFSCGRDELKMGQRASPASELIFDDVFVPDTHVIGGLRKGWALNRAVLNYSRIPVGAIALGIARGAVEEAIVFARNTELAGRKLLDFQDVQLAISQMLIDTSAMRSMIWQSASARVPDQARASMTKVFCSDTAVRTCESAMELLGNHGFLHGGPEKAYRDGRLTQIYEGTNDINRLAVIEDQAEQLLAAVEGQR